VDPEGRSGEDLLGGVGGGETVIRICCVRKTIFNRRENEKKKKKNDSIGSLCRNWQQMENN
jgi:hypothetical protein